MWSVFSQRFEPKPIMGQKEGYHTSIHTLMVSKPILDKEFNYFKSPVTSVCQSQSDRSITSNANSCNSKKKKKKKRRRKKKKNQEQSRPQRQRQISTASEDSVVIFFEDAEEQNSENETETDFGSSDSFLPAKKVHFASEESMCVVHPMVAWSYAYQAARKGPWEEYARDRVRFNERVMKTETLIGHIFGSEHRLKIFEERFA